MVRQTRPRVTIRHMTEDDISDVLAIDRALVGDRRVLTYADPVESYIGGSLAASWVAVVNRKVAGFALCRVVEPGLGTVGGAWIELIGVDPGAQHKGVGKALIDRLVDYCREKDLQQVSIIASRHDDVLRHFFGTVGFKQGDAISYTLRLEQ